MMNLQNIFNATSPGFALNSFGFYPFDTASSEKQNGGESKYVNSYWNKKDWFMVIV